MREKIISIALCMALIMPGAAFAKETECWEETKAPETAPAAEVEEEIAFNGKKIDIPEDFFSPDGYYVKFTALAALSGYSVDYDANTNTVICGKDGRTVKVKLSEEEVLEASESYDGKEENPFYILGEVDNGRLYVGKFELDTLFDIHCIDKSTYDDDWNLTLRKLDFYDIAPLKKKALTAAETLKKLVRISGENGINSLSGAFEFNISFVSEIYGIRLNGNSSIEFEQRNFEGKSYYKISADFKGVYKMLIALLAMDGYGVAYGSSAENEDLKTIRAIFEKPIEAEIYVSGEDLYVKSGVLAKLEILPDEAEDTFILYKGGAELLGGLDEMNNSSDMIDEGYEMIAQSLAIFALNEFGNYADAEKFIDAILSLYDENHIKITEKRGNTTVELKIAPEEIGKIFDMIISAEALKNGADGTDDTLRKILGSLKLSAEGKDEYKNGTYKGSSNVTLLTDIPSGIFDEPVGTLKAVCNITSSGGKKNESIKLPEKFKNGNIK